MKVKVTFLTSHLPILPSMQFLLSRQAHQGPPFVGESVSYQASTRLFCIMCATIAEPAREIPSGNGKTDLIDMRRRASQSGGQPSSNEKRTTGKLLSAQLASFFTFYQQISKRLIQRPQHIHTDCLPWPGTPPSQS